MLTWPHIHLDFPMLMLPVCWGGEYWTVVDIRLHDDCQYGFHTMQKYTHTQPQF